MKKLSITLMMLCCAIVGNAQVTDEISAILQVGDNAQIFYGADALIEAMAAAPDRGATITLSSGTFNAAEITKCVNIYGAGWVTELSPKNNDNLRTTASCLQLSTTPRTLTCLPNWQPPQHSY